MPGIPIQKPTDAEEGESEEMELGASTPAAAAAGSPLEMDIFILSGQSNMAGRGGVNSHKKWDHVVPPECRPHPSILRFSGQLRWEEAREPLHADIDAHKTCGIGPGMPFAHAILAAGAGAGRAVGLVPCAVGGTAIREWERGERLYAQMLRRVTAAVAEGGRIRAMLWYQGESDTTKEAAESYRTNMERLVRDFRSDLGLPDLPIIQVALASGMEPWRVVVRQAQLSMDLPNVVGVDAMGLQLNADHLHLATGAQIELGAMLAQAYLEHFASPAQEELGPA